MKRLILIALFVLSAVLVGLLTESKPVNAQAEGGGYVYISSATTTSVRNGNGFLRRVTINGGTAGAVTLYDIAIDGCTGTPASGKFATIEGIGSTNPVSLLYDLRVKNGICVVTAQATDVTVTFD